MASRDLTVHVHAEGVDALLATFRRLPAEADTALRRRTLDLAEALSHRVAAAARADSPQSALMARTVKARKGRVPAVAAGGSDRVGRNRKPAFKILFGSEFGSTTLHQFRPHLGRGSYWFFRTVEHGREATSTAWARAADDVVRAFGGTR